jgi:hypothetical protein
MLSMAFYPPGTCLVQPHRHTGGMDVQGQQRVYFIAEGECTVKRRTSHLAAHQENERSQPAYDADTLSVLGPQDIFGLDSSTLSSSSNVYSTSGAPAASQHLLSGSNKTTNNGWIIETLSQVIPR